MLQIVAGHVDKDGSALSANGTSVTSDDCPASGGFVCWKKKTGRYRILFPAGTFLEQPTVVATAARENLTDDKNQTGKRRTATVTYLDHQGEDSENDEPGCWLCTVAFKDGSGNNQDTAFFFQAIGQTGTTATEDEDGEVLGVTLTYVLWNDGNPTLVDSEGTELTSIPCNGAMTMDFIAAELNGDSKPEPSQTFHITGIHGLPWEVFGFPYATRTEDDAAFRWTCFNNCQSAQSYGFVLCVVNGTEAACTSDPQIVNTVPT